MHNFEANTDALSGKTILITGAGDGIGKAAALNYAALGANVILLGKTVSKLEAVYDQIEESGNVECAIVPLDLMGATPKHYHDMAQTIKSQFAKLDGVLFNASVLGQLQPFTQISESEYQQVMQVNVNSTFYMTQALLPVLKEASQASTIYTTSTVGHEGRAYWGSYAISKFATEGMMQILADEYSNSHLRFNCVNPGRTRTAMRAKAYPGEDPKTLKTAEEILGIYNYLMCDESIGVTGKTFYAQPELKAKSS